jgi:hypothetical protein
MNFPPEDKGPNSLDTHCPETGEDILRRVCYHDYMNNMVITFLISLDIVA